MSHVWYLLSNLLDFLAQATTAAVPKGMTQLTYGSGATMVSASGIPRVCCRCCDTSDQETEVDIGFATSIFSKVVTVALFLFSRLESHLGMHWWAPNRGTCKSFLKFRYHELLTIIYHYLSDSTTFLHYAIRVESQDLISYSPIIPGNPDATNRARKDHLAYSIGAISTQLQIVFPFFATPWTPVSPKPSHHRQLAVKTTEHQPVYSIYSKWP